MEEIEYGQHCFGSYIIVDGENLNFGEYDTRSEEYIRELKIKFLNELPNIVDRLSVYDLKTIAEIITQNNNDWEYDEEESKSSSCDQCGNYNYNEKYRRTK
jgi:hypothetical protein